MNELYFLVILASLLKYNTADDWEGTPTIAYTLELIYLNGLNLILNYNFKKFLILTFDYKCKNNFNENVKSSVNIF